MNYEIRWAVEADASELGMIHANSWKVAYDGIIPDEVLEKISSEKRAARFLKVITEKSEETAVIVVDTRIVGFITLGRCRDEDLSPDHGEVWGIYLSPANWRTGIGSKLLNWGISELAAKGYKKVSLWVLEDNHNARRFYEKHEFVHDGTIKQLIIGKEINEIRYIMIR
jgi:ribosomal protein S18 acetylase RimI-like enzyme